MTISKIANHDEFGNQIFAEMDKVLKTDFAEAPSSDAKEKTTLSTLVSEVAKVASELEALQHPLAKKADIVLSEIQKEIVK